MGCLRASVALILVLSSVLVDGFTFPGDWHKIRQIMDMRQQKEELTVRFGGGDTKVRFEDEYEDFNAYREIELSTTTTTTTQPPPVKIDPIMAEMMKTVNITELEIRFGHLNENGLSVRFGEPLEETPPPVAYKASDSIWNFTMAMVKVGLKDPVGNSLFSPVSILTTINMLLLGTKGSTKDEIMQALGYPRYSAQVHAEFQQIIKSMNNDIGVTVATSNALFTQVDFPIRESYKEELRRHYGEDIQIVPLDFTSRPRTTLRRMNGFISTNTNNMIREMFTVPVSPETKVVVSNCLYFNGSWEYEFLFDPPYFEGIPATFDSFGSKKNMTLMTSTLDIPYYKDEDLGLEMLSLPYEHDVRNEDISEAHMFLMMPTKTGKEAYEELETKFLTLNFEEIFQKMEPAYAGIELPRMQMEFQSNLKKVLEEIGINKLFSGKPSQDFAPMTDAWSEFKLDTLQHKAVLKITEKGTEAAAATAGVQFYLGPMFTVKFDRPFFLFIYDALNKVVIFWARVVEPQNIVEPLIPMN
eukprot:GFUD01131729.1.p1 GENE.GFUD01131729.1~~GFUD01131729.1.p1  ORF type:complete len:527 (+),score=142.23 GFUD01131729.1:57-1637(+)